MVAKHPASIESGTVQDAVELLTADHRHVASLFAQFDALKEEGSDEEKSAKVAQICRELTIHTAIEEDIFYPAVRKATQDDDLMDEALVEHAGAKELIAQLQAADPEDDLYDAKVTVLGEQIEHHVTEEEGSMFPKARAADLDTVSLGAELRARKAELAVNSSAAAHMPAASARMLDADDAGDDEDEDLHKLKPLAKSKRAPSVKSPAPPTAKKKTTKKKKR